MAGKMTDEQKAKLKAGREAAKAARAAQQSSGSTTAPAVGPVTFRPSKKVGAPIAKLVIPRGTPVDAVAATLASMLAEAREQGLNPVKAGGVIKLF